MQSKPLGANKKPKGETGIDKAIREVTIVTRSHEIEHIHSEMDSVAETLSELLSKIWEDGAVLTVLFDGEDFYLSIRFKEGDEYIW